MKHLPLLIFLVLVLLAASCTSKKKLAYLNNLPEARGEQFFTMEIPDYKIQPRDVLYITLKAMNPEGRIEISWSSSVQYNCILAGERGGYLYGYEVNSEGNITLPVLGEIKVMDLNLERGQDIITG